LPDPRSVDVWMRWEFEKLNAGLVVRPQTLRALVEDGVVLRTKDGDAFHVDPRILTRIAAVCSAEDQSRLRLPVTIHFSEAVPDSAYISDALAVEILHRLEAWGKAYPFRDGKMWLPQSLAVDLVLRYGGALQRLVL